MNILLNILFFVLQKQVGYTTLELNVDELKMTWFWLLVNYTVRNDFFEDYWDTFYMKILFQSFYFKIASLINLTCHFFVIIFEMY